MRACAIATALVYERHTRKIVSSLFTIWFRYINKKLFSFFYICKILMFWLFACLLAAMVCRRCRWFVLARCAANERFIASLAGCLLVYLFAPPRAVCRLIYVFIWMSVQAFIARQGGEWAMCWQKFCQRHLVTVAAGVCHCHGAVAYLLFSLLLLLFHYSWSLITKWQ